MYEAFIEIAGLTTAFTLLGMVFVVFPWVAIKLTVYGWRRIDRQDLELREELGRKHGAIKIFRNFPMPQKYEDVIQGAIEHTIQSLRFLVTNDEWILAEISFSNLATMTLYERRNATAVTIYALPLEEYTPQIAVQSRNTKNFLFRNIRDKIKHGELIKCEGVFNASQRVYAEKGSQVDVLSILSPEVLEDLQDPPFDADIYLKRNVLYYLFRTRNNPYETLEALEPHADRLKSELRDNLRRWSTASSNQGKLEEIKRTELAVTLREKYERGLL